ncbi:MAG: hypothetical protein ACLQLG_12740 [Thermoguttaceae bacterium]
MARAILACVCVLFLTAGRGAAAAEQAVPALPTTYEVLINGESFRVEADRATKVQSAKKPGVSYELAVRIAPTQVLRLNTVGLEYDMPANVFDDRGARQRTIEIRHQLGFNVLLTDLGGPLEAKDQDEVLKSRIDAVVKLHHDEKPEVGKPFQAKFAGAAGQGTIVRYKDARGVGHSCVVCVLGGPNFSVACVIEYHDDDRKDVMPTIARILDSLRGLP